ncbi:unnamed protein product, partial [Allacma fusca]
VEVKGNYWTLKSAREAEEKALETSTVENDTGNEVLSLGRKMQNRKQFCHSNSERSDSEERETLATTTSCLCYNRNKEFSKIHFRVLQTILLFRVWSPHGIFCILNRDLVSSWGDSESPDETESSEKINVRFRRIAVFGKGKSGYVEVFEHDDFKGVKLTLQNDPQRCINFHRSNISNFNDHITSVKLNGNCLDIYSGVGCVGQHLVLNSRTDCLKHLGNCQWNDRISSLKFCATILPEVYQKPKGSQGDLCIDSCENNGKYYFSCHLSNGSKDYCSPRPGMDYFGNAHNQHLSSDIQSKHQV